MQIGVNMLVEIGDNLNVGPVEEAVREYYPYPSYERVRIIKETIYRCPILKQLVLYW